MEKEFFRRIEDLGSGYLMEFAMRHDLKTLQQLVHQLEIHAEYLQQVVDRTLGEDPKETESKDPNVFGGFRTQEDELAHVRTLISELRARLGAQA